MEQYEVTLAKLNQMIDLNPADAWALAHRGELFRLTGCYTQALTDLNQAIAQKNDYAWALAHRGVLYRWLQAYEKALADLTCAIDLKPDYAWALAHRGSIFTILRRYADALCELDRIIAVAPALIPSGPGERGMLLNYLGRYAETMICCRQGLALCPTDYAARYSLTVALTQANGLNVAQSEIALTRAYLEAILQRELLDSATQAAVLYRLGGLAALQGWSEQAVHYLKEAVAVDDEPGEMARHDPAWLPLREHNAFQAILTSARKVHFFHES